jgi:hypothetical protein
VAADATLFFSVALQKAPRIAAAYLSGRRLAYVIAEGDATRIGEHSAICIRQQRRAA